MFENASDTYEFHGQQLAVRCCVAHTDDYREHLPGVTDVWHELMNFEAAVFC